MILDEPFSGLDPANSQMLKDVVNELIQEGKLVVFSSNQMSYVEEFCKEIAGAIASICQLGLVMTSGIIGYKTNGKTWNSA